MTLNNQYNQCKKLLSLDNFEEVQKHLSSCKECKEEFDIRKEFVDLLKEIRPSVRFQTEKTKDCLNTETLNRYKQNKMTEEEVLKTEDHISKCHYCLDKVFNVVNTQESNINVRVYEPHLEPKIIQLDLYNTLKENMQKLKSIQLRLAARAGAIPKHEDVVAKHEVCFLSKEGKINLMSKEICKDELSRVRTALNGNDFFYSVFHVNKDNRVEEVLQTKEEEYPARMVVKDEGFLFLIVLVSLDRDTIEKINKENVLDYCGKLFDSLKDLICIFGKIKRD